MARSYTPDELVTRTFLLTIVGIGLWIAAVFLFVL